MMSLFVLDSSGGRNRMRSSRSSSRLAVIKVGHDFDSINTGQILGIIMAKR